MMNDSSPNSIGPWVASSSAAIQQMYSVIIPFITKNLPSEAEVESSFMQEAAQNAAQDYPTMK